MQSIWSTYSAEEATYWSCKLPLPHIRSKFPISFPFLLVHSNIRSHFMTARKICLVVRAHASDTSAVGFFPSTSFLCSPGWIPSYFFICKRVIQVGNAIKEAVTCRLKILRSAQITQPNKTDQAEVSFTVIPCLRDCMIPLLPEALSAKVQVSTAVLSRSIFQHLYYVICKGDKC